MRLYQVNVNFLPEINSGERPALERLGMAFSAERHEANRFRYSTYGREANRTLRTLLVPKRKSVPSWV